MLKAKLSYKPDKPYVGVRAAVDAFLIDVGLKTKESEKPPPVQSDPDDYFGNEFN